MEGYAPPRQLQQDIPPWKLNINYAPYPQQPQPSTFVFNNYGQPYLQQPPSYQQSQFYHHQPAQYSIPQQQQQLLHPLSIYTGTGTYDTFPPQIALARDGDYAPPSTYLSAPAVPTGDLGHSPRPRSNSLVSVQSLDSLISCSQQSSIPSPIIHNFTTMPSPIAPPTACASPYSDPLFFNDTIPDELDLFASLDDSQLLTDTDGQPFGDFTHTLRIQPGVGVSPLSLAEDSFSAASNNNEDTLEGLFCDLELMNGGGDSSTSSSTSTSIPTSSYDTNPSPSSTTTLPIPNLIISSPDTTTTTTPHHHTTKSSDMSDSDEPVPPKSPYLDTSLDDVVVVKPDGAEDYTASKDGGFFKCACGKGFKKLSSLRSHARLHGRERNFICDKCHKGFLRKHDLTRHATSHISGVKPYICPCGVTFTRQDAMMRHIRAGRCERPGRGRGRTNPRSMLIAVNTPQHMGPVFTQYFPSPLLQQQQQQQQKQRSHPPQQPHSTSQPVLIPVFAAGHPPSEPSSSSFSVRP